MDFRPRRGDPRRMAVPDDDLSRAAYAVADEFRMGHLRHLTGRAWADTWRRLVCELAVRCPGHTDAEYEAALDRGFVESR